eukprot:TRINITY_DN13896_c0_g1_i1.p1 TRINITY_DN13896_c0_g1~~TRINITY_DN13896_c0_g1_i1.p1  ORF type:complete len:969 (+),score=169.77 TRINITY_DN13896_c0_g1_i1:45-2951(+)
MVHVVHHDHAKAAQASSRVTVALDASLTEGAKLGPEHFNTARKYGMTDEDLRRCHVAFDGYDRDHSGHISLNELRDLLNLVSGREMSDEEFNQTAQRYDKDGDHTIDFSEFLEAFCRTPVYRSKNLEKMIESLSKDIRSTLEKGSQTAEWKAYHAGCTMGSLVRYLQSEMAVMNSLMQLPATLLMITSFTVAVLLHTRLQEAQASDFSIVFDIQENANFAFTGTVPLQNGRMGHKGLEDVNFIGDIWSWLNLGLVPLLWYEGWDLSEAAANLGAMCVSAKDKIEAFGLDTSGLSAGSLDQQLLRDGCEKLTAGSPEAPKGWYGTPSTPTYLYYRSVIGGVRLSQLRTEVVPCEPFSHSYRTKIHTGECVSGARGFWLYPEVRDALLMYMDNPPGIETVYLKSALSQTEIRQQLRALEESVWISPRTSSVRATFTTYNPHVDGFTATYVQFEINRAGHIFKLIHSCTFFLNPYFNLWCWVADVVWVLLVFKMFVEEFHDFVRSVRKHGGFMIGLKDYIGLDNFVDWLNIFMSVFIIIQWVIFLQQVEDLKAFLEKGSVTVPGTFADDTIREQYYHHVDDMVLFYESRTFALAAYPFMVIFRLFKAFSAQPRLALVTNTLVAAAVDLFHFGFVFLTVFLLFTVSGIVLFGHSMQEFAEFFIAADTCFHILLGDFDWEEMRKAGRMPAGVWFWMYMWMVEIVMFNMLLAIVTDIYTEVRGSISGEASTMWKQAHDLVRRRWQLFKGERVSLAHIVRCLEGYEGSIEGSIITVKGFMKLVPKLPETQAFRLIRSTIDIEEAASGNMSASLSSAVTSIARMESAISNLQETVDSSVHLNEMGTTFLKSEIRNLARGADLEGKPGLTSSDLPPPWLEAFMERHTAAVTKHLSDVSSQVDELNRQQQVQQQQWQMMQQQLQMLLAVHKVPTNGHALVGLQGRPPPPPSAFDSLCSAGARAPPQHLVVGHSPGNVK